VAIYPRAIRRLIPPGSNDPRITATQVILHVAVSEQSSLYDYFARRSGGIESHFYIRRDGTVEQYRDTAYQADANYTANVRAISVETQGMAAGEWTAAQLDAIKALLTWAHKTHGIPLRKCPGDTAAGIGYHSQFRSWSPVAKSCPGPDRIKQFDRVLVPWMSAPEEDDMPLSDADKKWIEDTVNAAVESRVGDVVTPPNARPPENPKAEAQYAIGKIWAAVEEIKAKVDDLGK
jgi:hypothetical protein